MNTSEVISAVGLGVSILINVGAICFFAGTITTIVKNIKEDIKRLETKQDKHNNVIERMAIVEQSTKSSHHRQDTFEKRLDNIERKI